MIADILLGFCHFINLLSPVLVSVSKSFTLCVTNMFSVTEFKYIGMYIQHFENNCF